MSRNYYCDFCEKSFYDDLYSRKKHLASAQHQRARFEYYESFKTTGKSVGMQNIQGLSSLNVGTTFSPTTFIVSALTSRKLQKSFLKKPSISAFTLNGISRDSSDES